MGVDYHVWIIPKESAFRANADQFANLANALRDGNWVPKPDSGGQHSEVLELLPGGDMTRAKPKRVENFTADAFTASWVASHSEHELVLRWDVQDMLAAGVQYPFTFDPYPDSGPPYFYVYLILGDNYFYYTGETVMPIDESATKCLCGEQLAYRTGYSVAPSQRIDRTCPKCGRTFDLSTASCDVLDGFTGEPTPLRGGLTFRFALIVNCHKYWPREVEELKRFHLRPEFLDLWRTHIGVSFEQVVTFD